MSEFIDYFFSNKGINHRISVIKFIKKKTPGKLVTNLRLKYFLRLTVLMLFALLKDRFITKLR